MVFRYFVYGASTHAKGANGNLKFYSPARSKFDYVIMEETSNRISMAL